MANDFRVNDKVAFYDKDRFTGVVNKIKDAAKMVVTLPDNTDKTIHYKQARILKRRPPLAAWIAYDATFSALAVFSHAPTAEELASIVGTVAGVSVLTETPKPGENDIEIEGGEFS